MNDTEEAQAPLAKTIMHTGVVESFSGSIARVRIYHGGNCGVCSAKGGCGAASLGEEGQSVDVRFDGSLTIGQKVNVALRQRTDLLAIFLAFLVPIVLLVGSVLAFTRLGLEQKWAALASLGVVVLWIGVLALLRKPLQKKFELMIVVD